MGVYIFQDNWSNISFYQKWKLILFFYSVYSSSFFFCAKGLTSLKGRYICFGLLLKSTTFSSDIFESLIKSEFQILLRYHYICQGDTDKVYKDINLFLIFLETKSEEISLFRNRQSRKSHKFYFYTCLYFVFIRKSYLQRDLNHFCLKLRLHKFIIISVQKLHWDPSDLFLL